MHRSFDHQPFVYSPEREVSAAPTGRPVLNKGSLASPRDGAEHCIRPSELFDDPSRQPITTQVYGAVRQDVSGPGSATRGW